AAARQGACRQCYLRGAMTDTAKWVLEVCDAVAAIPASDWNACAGPDNPFVQHEFLAALEDSGAVAREAGWLPRHLALRDETGRLRGAMPLYLKSHSLGEYVFDHAWADAYMRAGGRYYPKLLAAVPFTPVTGPRLLPAPGTDETAVWAALLQAPTQLPAKHGISSLHV